FQPPLRPSLGSLGRTIRLQANFFQVDIPKGFLQHYEVEVKPDKCPRRVNREVVLHMVQHYKQIFGERKPVYDGRQNLYTATPLPIGWDRADWDGSSIREGQREPPAKLHVVDLPLLCWTTLHDVQEGTQHVATVEHDAQISTVSDGVARGCPVLAVCPAGCEYFVLSQGWQCPVRGKAVCPCLFKRMLAMAVSATAFYKAQPVVEFLCEILGVHSLDDQRKPLTDSQRVAFTKEITGLKVEITHCGQMKRKYRVCSVSRKSASHQTFPLQLESGQTVECSVAHYFREKHKLQLRYPHLPCLQVGQKEKHTYLPLEVCNIVPGQRCIRRLTDSQTSTMIKATARSAPDRQEEISKLMKNANFKGDPFMREFEIRVRDDMTEVTGRVLPAPMLQYGGHV
uniref:PAZ domain-containing protein n=1 Tax=Petromyzon marinus TaxID=7757 RepID=S4RV61_PETMA